LGSDLRTASPRPIAHKAAEAGDLFVGVVVASEAQTGFIERGLAVARDGVSQPLAVADPAVLSSTTAPDAILASQVKTSPWRGTGDLARGFRACHAVGMSGAALFTTFHP
jgi:hypothetical protein